MSEIMNNGMNEIGGNGIKGNGTEEMFLQHFFLRWTAVLEVRPE